MTRIRDRRSINHTYRYIYVVHGDYSLTSQILKTGGREQINKTFTRQNVEKAFLGF